jgi:hypothetical protein
VKIRTSILHFIFAVLLLLSQQMAVSHAISHTEILTQSVVQDDGQPSDSVCDQCLALCSLASALGGTFSFGLGNLFAHTKIALDVFENFFPANLRPFNSRAPPVL